MPSYIARQGGNLANGNFIPEIWSKKINVRFYPSSVLDQIVNRDWEGEIKGGGSKVMIRVAPTVVVSDYSVNQVLSYQDLQDDKIELMLDKAYSFGFKCDDVDAAQSDIKILNETTQDAAQQMATKVDTAVLGSAYADAGSALNSTAVTKATVLDWIVDAMVKLSEENAPSEGRFVVIPPWIAGMILKSDLKDASIAGDGTSILRNGRLGMIANATIYQSNNLAVTSAGTTWNCIAGTKHAITHAAQLTKVETVRLQDRFADAVRGLLVWGMKVVKPEALVHMPATKS